MTGENSLLWLDVTSVIFSTVCSLEYPHISEPFTISCMPGLNKLDLDMNMLVFRQRFSWPSNWFLDFFLYLKNYTCISTPNSNFYFYQPAMLLVCLCSISPCYEKCPQAYILKECGTYLVQFSFFRNTLLHCLITNDWKLLFHKFCKILGLFITGA